MRSFTIGTPPSKRSSTSVAFIGTECFLHSCIALQVLIAVQPKAQMQYFDVESKTWKPLASTILPIEATFCYCAASADNKLYVAVTEGSAHYIYSYDTEGNVWEKQPHSCSVISNLCIIEDHMYAVSSNYHNVPQRYNFATRQWQSFAKVSTHCLVLYITLGQP